MEINSINADQQSTDIQIDEGTLLATSYNQFDTEQLKLKTEDYLKSLTRNNTQLLINKIWELPNERIDQIFVAKLPKPSYILPRARVVPKPKGLTKWQQYAKEKGIVSKKKGKSKLKWDDELQKWIPTYGYLRNKSEKQKEWLVEVGDDNTPKADPRETLSRKKQENVAKNELQRLRNLAKSKNIKIPRVGLPTIEQFASSKHLSTATTVARVSTASVGKFQPKLPKEKDAKDIAKEVPGFKKKPKTPPANLAEEKTRNTALLNDIFDKKSRKNILSVETSTPSTSSRSSRSGGIKKRKLTSSSAKKPKAGKGKRNLRTKTVGRKRR